MCLGVWVVAHEAGHGAFSTSDTVNAVAGTILHSFLLVPFFSWKFTHAAHHGATNHLRKDQVFVPQTKVKKKKNKRKEESRTKFDNLSFKRRRHFLIVAFTKLSRILQF